MLFSMRCFAAFQRKHKRHLVMIDRYTREEMAEVWSEESRFQTFLDVEIAASEAQSKLGHVPKEDLEIIKKKAGFDVARIKELDKELHHETIAFLTCVAEFIDGDSSRFVHLGMTSSDLLDTALNLQISKASKLLTSGADKLLEALKKQALEHKTTVCMGRSHGVHAEPTSFGLKMLGFYDEIKRSKANLEIAAENMKVAMVSGAIGTYANVDPKVEELVAKNLGLKPAKISTQVIGRDRHSHYVTALANMASSIERIAVEIRHLQRTEVLEVEEPFVKGQKGSSAMPHKRNPWRSENLSGLARMMRSYASVAMENIPLWHERDMSHSSTERVVLPDATIVLDFMLDRMSWIINDLNVYPENMLRNMNRFGAVSFSQQLLLKLIDKAMKREDAYKLVQMLAHQAWNSYDDKGNEVSFRALVEASSDIKASLSDAEIANVFDPSYHLKNIDSVYKKILV